MKLQIALNRLAEEIEKTTSKAKVVFLASEVLKLLKNYIEKTEQHVSQIEFENMELTIALENVQKEKNKTQRIYDDGIEILTNLLLIEKYMSIHYPNVTRRPEYGSEAFYQFINKIKNGLSEN